MLAALAAAALAASATGQLAYSNANGDLLLADADGGAEQVLFTADASTSLQALEIAPGGKAVLALASGDTTRIVLVPAAGGDPKDVEGTDDADAGSISPDGATIVFTTTEGVFSVAAAGGTPKELASTPDGSTDSLPQISPDGATIAFARDTVDANGDEVVTLEVMPAAGGTPAPRATNLAGTLSQGGRISFSPDGASLAYAGDGDNPGIYVVGAKSGNAAQLTTGLDAWPVWSADGGTVLFSRDSSSDDSDLNSDDPIDPIDGDDLYELWSVAKDGAHAAVIHEGDYEELAGAQVAGAAPPAATPPTAKVAVSITKSGVRYTVRWTGTAPSWRVTLTVGKTKMSAIVAGAVHVRTFRLPKAKGRATARVVARTSPSR